MIEWMQGGEWHSPVMMGYPAIAAGVDEMSVGSRRASSWKACRVASMPRVAPRSLSAARASKNAWVTVVFSDVMNLDVGVAVGRVSYRRGAPG